MNAGLHFLKEQCGFAVPAQAAKPRHFLGQVVQLCRLHAESFHKVKVVDQDRTLVFGGDAAIPHIRWRGSLSAWR